MLTKDRQKLPFSSFGRRLLFWIILSSSLITTLFTFYSFRQFYLDEMEHLTASIKQLKIANLSSMSESLYHLDTQQIHIQAKGLLGIPNVVRVEVWDTKPIVKLKKELKTTSEEKNWYLQLSRRMFPNYLEDHDFKLEYKNVSKVEKLGTLKVRFDLSSIHAKLLYKAFMFFLSQGTKTLLVSILIVTVFNVLFTRHIKKIVSYLREVNLEESPGQKEIIIDRKPNNNHNDEIDILHLNITNMLEKIREKSKQKDDVIKEQQEDIDTHKKNAFMAAKLASLGRMAGGIAHEINNPLAIIKGHLLILQNYGFLDDESEKVVLNSVGKMDKHTNRISTIIKGLLDFSKDDSEQQVYKSYSVKKLIDDSLSLCTSRLFQDNISVNQVYEGCDETLHIDVKVSLMKQVLFSLLSNAIDAVKGKEDAWITLVTKKTSGSVLILVRDSGTGIPQDIKDKVLDPFFTTKNIGEGIGLSLSLSLGIVESHGGQLTIKDEANTCFQIALPLRQS